MEKRGEDNNNRNKSNPFRIYVLLLSLAIIFAWGLTIYLLKDDPLRGTFGDMFGSVNALFSGFALLGIVVAIILQKIELELQREELKATREEIKAQTEALKHQEEAMKQQAEVMRKQSLTLEFQRFDSKFFSLLESHRNLGQTLHFPSNNITGINGFEVLLNSIKQSASLGQKVSNSEDFTKWLGENEQKYILPIKQYFDSLENLLVLLEEGESSYSAIRDEDIVIYAQTLKSHMSVYELYWAAIYCYTPFGQDSFKGRVLAYNLFENLPPIRGHKIYNFISAVTRKVDEE